MWILKQTHRPHPLIVQPHTLLVPLFPLLVPLLLLLLILLLLEVLSSAVGGLLEPRNVQVLL
jgi:hypothetical protein